MSSFSYSAFGLSIHSDFELNALKSVGSRSDYDLTIDLGKIESHYCDHKDEPVIKKETIAGYVVSVRGIAVFLIRSNKITIEVTTDRPKLVESILISEIFPTLLSLRDLLVIRGAAVEINGKTFLLVGPSGIGKSTILAGLHKKGYTILSDQVCVLRSNNNKVEFIPSLTKLKLWEDSLKFLDIKYNHLEKVREELPKYYFDVAPKEVGGNYEIFGIIILKISELLAEGELKSSDLTIIECFENLNKNSIREQHLSYYTNKESNFQALMNLSSNSTRRLIVRPHALFNITSFVDHIELELQNV